MNKIIIAMALLVFISTGCIAPQATIKSPRPYTFTSFDIGPTMTSTVGSPMLVKENSKVFDKYIARQTVDAVFGNKVVEGSVWESLVSFDGHDVLTSSSFMNRGVGAMIDNGRLVSGRQFLSMSVLQPSALNRPLAGTYTFACPSCPDDLFEKSKDVVTAKGSYKYELIYSGKSGSTITLNYREYVDDFARPAFFQQVQYDLAASDIVTFRDINLKIIDADNNKISFIVIKG